MREFDDVERTILDYLDNAYGSPETPPPSLDAAVSPGGPTGVAPERLDVQRRALQTRLLQGIKLGALLRRRRESMGLDLEETCLRARWPATRLEELEASVIDLHRVPPEAMARLLRALAVHSVDPLDAPLRSLAREHLAVYQSIDGPLYGRTRRDVSAADRRRDLTRGVMPVDEEATARAADRYLRAVQTAMEQDLA
jgi:hypothetical protein